MAIRRSLIYVAALAVLTSVSPALADIQVRFEPTDPSVNVGAFVTVDIMASFDEPVVGWGLDMTIGEPTYAAWTGTTIDTGWDSTTTIDGDGLAGLRFPDGLSGEVRLATLTFEGLALGVTPLSLSSGPEEDEGFLLASGDLETNVQFIGTSLTVTPEPGAAMLLLVLAAGGLRRRR